MPAEASNFTNGKINGREWKVLTSHEKVVFLHGLLEGASDMLGNLQIRSIIPPGLYIGDSPSNVKDTFFTAKFDFNDLSEQITSLYSDPENINVPVSAMYRLALRILNKETEATSRNVSVGELLKYYRKTSMLDESK